MTMSFSDVVDSCFLNKLTLLLKRVSFPETCLYVSVSKKTGFCLRTGLSSRYGCFSL